MSRKITREEAKEKPQAAPAEMRAAEIARQKEVGLMPSMTEVRDTLGQSAFGATTNAVIAAGATATGLLTLPVVPFATLGAATPPVLLAMKKLFQKSGILRRNQGGKAPSVTAT